MWKLSIEDDQGNKTVVNLVRNEYTVGRGDENTVRLTERNISRTHAVLRQNGAGWVLEDLESYNGVFVNGVRVAGNQPLDHGDLVQVGDYRLVVSDEEALATSDATSTAPTVPKSQSLLDQPDRLVMITGPAPGEEYPLVGDRLVVGRGEECDIPINHGSVSRVHAEIAALGDGRYEIIDKESANGVRVNGVELERSLLDARDLIELGDVQLKFIPQGVVYRLADESAQLDAFAAERRSSSPAAGTAIDRLPTGVKVVGGVFLLGTFVVLGMLIFGGRSTSSAADEVIAATASDRSARLLEQAVALMESGEYEKAHQLVLRELSEESNARKSSEFRAVEAAWADHLLEQAEQAEGTEKRELLDRVAKATTVDTGRRKRANDALVELQAEAVDISELPSDHPRRVRAAPTATSTVPKPAATPGTIVRENPFDNSDIPAAP